LRLPSAYQCSGEGVGRRVKWFGRGRGLSLRLRLADLALGLSYRGGWPAVIALRLGLQGTVRTTSHTFGLPSRSATTPPLRVGFASDFHAGPTTHPSVLAQACRALADAKPDVLLLGGDFVSFHARYIDGLLPHLAAIDAPLGTFAVLGNHDLMADDRYIADRLEAIGIRLLLNRSVRLPAPHDDVWLCGLDDPDEGAPDAAAAFAGAAGTRLVLMHSPDGLRAIGDRRFAVAFCGHTHGGQVVLRSGRRLIVPQGPLSRQYLRGGVFRLCGSHDRVLLVSRGVGCTLVPVRRSADPEVHVCTLQASVGNASAAS
jgi:predicted MPP superfamily phosphohydrolase